ncbi:YiiX/YebB-like N1pC/P60 family cysteine hydrolase [Denitrificimonas sp. JX-1]|uniref:YiiX/YebB-like N1pC/P60 family cysteine hydrolase n=1 Tax=Denitrificimonas halotolerans TaxID=3098930 RepID=A0ABU5GPV1_9GAMM|nr:YiiX/YebB-like N1pC/P60 family cysteine hydrolase [Denitrificimonas sp. JX-1]MDY7218385.1 YiiX/YebB-like N1pC/P60 family cysteine hydrolase [Denitrificimonas sp. JX-1]
MSFALYIAQALAARNIATPALTELPQLAVGDWIFRAGTSSESQLIQSLSSGEFSHIGMIVNLHPEPLIVHATTDDDPQRANQVLTSTLSEFIDPKRARRFAIARPKFLSTTDAQKAAQHALRKLGQPFVLTQRKHQPLYCTTLIADALQHSNTSFQPVWQHINAPLFSGEYLFPSAFAAHPDIDWIYHSHNTLK